MGLFSKDPEPETDTQADFDESGSCRREPTPREQATDKWARLYAAQSDTPTDSGRWFG